ncbi:hypothetical protein K530_51620 [Streptomyces noursei CCRC 11814]|nr:hypothetical protein K530_51620 [Streptomyces noursei CCRC 11814]
MIATADARFDRDAVGSGVPALIEFCVGRSAS